jgi:hypothetical protein
MEEMENKEKDAFKMRRLQEENRRLCEELKFAREANRSHLEQAVRKSLKAERLELELANASRELAKARSDVQKLAAYNGSLWLSQELQRTRDKYTKLHAKRAQWMSFARNCLDSKVQASQELRDLQSMVNGLKNKADDVARQRDMVEENAAVVIRSYEKQIERIADQCRLWKRCELGALAVLAGITAEVGGYPLPEPGDWERTKAIRSAETLSQVRQLTDQLDRISAVLEDAGVGRTGSYVRQVRELRSLYEGQLAASAELHDLLCFLLGHFGADKGVRAAAVAHDYERVVFLLLSSEEADSD